MKGDPKSTLTAKSLPGKLCNLLATEEAVWSETPHRHPNYPGKAAVRACKQPQDQAVGS